MLAFAMMVAGSNSESSCTPDLWTCSVGTTKRLEAGKDCISSVIMRGRQMQSAHISAAVGNVVLTLIAVRLRPSPKLALLRSQLSKACLEFSLGSEFSLIECRHLNGIRAQWFTAIWC